MPEFFAPPGVWIGNGSGDAITGVATSVAAFVGRTARGPLDTAHKVHGFSDFERSFGGLHPDSDLSSAVSHFFLNGGGACWVVRVAEDACAASVTLKTEGGLPTLVTTAASEGAWGEALLLRVEPAADDPLNAFDLTVIEMGARNGRPAPLRVETHHGISMDDRATTYAPAAVNAASELIMLADAGLAGSLAATAAGGRTLADADVAGLCAATRRLTIAVDGRPATEITLFEGVNDLATVNALARRIEERINRIDGVAGVVGASDAGVLSFASGTLGRRSALVLGDAAYENAAAVLGLGVANGGREIAGASEILPAASGVTGGRIEDFAAVPLAANDAIEVALVDIDAAGAVAGPPIETLDLALTSVPASLAAARDRLQAGLSASPSPTFADARVAVVDGALHVLPSLAAPGCALVFSGAGAEALRLASPGVRFVNVAAYQPGVGGTRAAQDAGSRGDDGTPPSAARYAGDPAARTGVHALEDADVFNILALPGVGDPAALAPALGLAEARRAMMLLDVDADTFEGARAWMDDPARGALKSPNAVAYFPRVRLPDPLQDGQLRAFANSGVIAGLWARTDAERGVWKAPAGATAALRGVQALDCALSAQENRALNALGLNCLRAFPALGIVSWGARTLHGADARVSEWKYVPVRRLALFIEESLARGTRFAVFEPNDKPLWARLRLSVGAFMDGLFRQGAFQGASAREANFVKCDADTTTPADIDRGVVTIRAGFAPLKPAEFVVLTVGQAAGGLPPSRP